MLADGVEPPTDSNSTHEPEQPEELQLLELNRLQNPTQLPQHHNQQQQQPQGDNVQVQTGIEEQSIQETNVPVVTRLSRKRAARRSIPLQHQHEEELNPPQLPPQQQQQQQQCEHAQEDNVQQQQQQQQQQHEHAEDNVQQQAVIEKQSIRQNNVTRLSNLRETRRFRTILVRTSSNE